MKEVYNPAKIAKNERHLDNVAHADHTIWHNTYFENGIGNPGYARKQMRESLREPQHDLPKRK